jgi:hypothetical protein
MAAGLLVVILIVTHHGVLALLLGVAALALTVIAARAVARR